MTKKCMARILFLAEKTKINMSVILSYPLTPIPVALCHVDDNFYKTAKSVLVNKLEKKVKS
jgi:hypothetical protein